MTALAFENLRSVVLGQRNQISFRRSSGKVDAELRRNTLNANELAAPKMIDYSAFKWPFELDADLWTMTYHVSA
jgi:hypothetical protein